MATQSDRDLVGQIVEALQSIAVARDSGSLPEGAAREALKETVRAALARDSEKLLEPILYALEPLRVDEVGDLLREFATSQIALEVAAYSLPQEEARLFISRAGRKLGSRTQLFDVVSVRSMHRPFGGHPSLSRGMHPDWNGSKLESITAIIHGTSATQGLWWLPRTSFCASVHRKVGDVYQNSDCFWWGGGAKHEEVQRAASQLTDWVEAHLLAGGFLRLICHSNGGNVAMFATRLGLRIDRLILLGTPIRTDIVPDIRNVGLVHNIYIPWDSYQSVGAALARRGEGRTLADSQHVINHPALLAAGKGPNRSMVAHSRLHTWTLWRANGLADCLA